MSRSTTHPEELKRHGRLARTGALVSTGVLLVAATGCTKAVTYIPQAAASGREAAVGTANPGSSSVANAPSPSAAPTAARVESLTMGSKGEAVTVFQSRLGKIGCKTIVNGSFDAQTLAAMQTFETNKKIPLTTVLDGATKTALNASVEAGEVNCGFPKASLQELLSKGALPDCGGPLAPTTPCTQRPTPSASPTPTGLLKYITLP